ncbi:MAG: haloacid dehalogenase [Cyanobium sp.]|nr:HAD-IA family hydrolase [Synechococcus sp. CS-1333]PZV21884.1 MAG: haloacid dehalogenase [Cyanobium sp.]
MGTLIGLRESVGTTYAAAAAGHGITLSAAAIDQVFPAVLRQAPPLAFPGLQQQELERAERQWWGARIDAALQGAGSGARAPGALQEELYLRFADPALWRVLPGVAPALEHWAAVGLRLAVVSNFDGRLNGLLSGLGLAEHLQAVIVSSAAGAAKPDPLPFRLALTALGLEAAEVWHVGDSPEDAEGAAATGVRCLRIQRP